MQMRVEARKNTRKLLSRRRTSASTPRNCRRREPWPGCGRGGVFCFKQKTAYEIGLGIPAEPLFRSAVQNQNEPQLRDENAHNDKSVHGVLNPTYQAGLRRDAVQPDIEAERKKRDEIEAGKSYCS